MNSRTLKILLICKTMPWQFTGGIQTHTWQLALALIKKGHEVTILSGGPFRSKEKRLTKLGVHWVTIPYLPGRYIKPISFAAEEIAFNWGAKNWVKMHHPDFDIIHAQGRSGYLLHLIKGVSNKLVNTIHGLIDLENKPKHWYDINRRLHTRLSRIFERRLLQNSRLSISVSQALKEQVKQLRKHRDLEVISNGVSGQQAPKQIALQKPLRFLFVGRLHPIKGIAAIVEHLGITGRKLCLDIVGTGAEYNMLRQLIKRHGLEQYVRLLGEYSNQKVHEILPNYQALILPSQYETQGIVLLEANAHSIPVIASDIPAIRETVQNNHNGLLCPPDQPEAFVQAMEYITQHPWETERMGQNGRRKVLESFTWDIVAEQTIEAYYKIAQ